MMEEGRGGRGGATGINGGAGDIGMEDVAVSRKNKETKIIIILSNIL